MQEYTHEIDTGSPVESDYYEEPSEVPQPRRHRLKGNQDQSPAPSAKRATKRNNLSFIGGPPLKRQKGTLNQEYLDILNKDIEDASLGVSLDGEELLDPSKVGLTLWSPIEKRQLYEALARDGEPHIEKIASKLGTKSVLEVRHYIQFVRSLAKSRRGTKDRCLLQFSEMPAAVEMSQECCQAQEEAADAVSVRQEKHEQFRESTKWGNYWDITPKIAAALHKRTEESSLPDYPFARLFNLPQWLELSRRVFMNSSVPDGNWTNFESEPPSIWATSLEDFHSLTLSITKRLVQASLFMAMSRIRTQSTFNPNIKQRVRRRDVRAAIASLSLPRDASTFWASCPRRLRLDVVDPLDTDIDNSQTEPLSYNDVEAALSTSQRNSDFESAIKTQRANSESAEDPALDSDSGSDISEMLDTNADGEDNDANPNVEADVAEALQYSATTVRDLRRFRLALTARIKADYKDELHADDIDKRNSAQAESQMWKSLQNAPSKPPPKLKRRLPQAPRTILSTTDIDLPSTEDWDEKTTYYAPWETLARAPVQDEEAAGADDDASLSDLDGTDYDQGSQFGASEPSEASELELDDD